MPPEKGIIQTVLGNGSEGWDGDGGPVPLSINTNVTGY